jgi:hypothetical protein
MNECIQISLPHLHRQSYLVVLDNGILGIAVEFSEGTRHHRLLQGMLRCLSGIEKGVRRLQTSVSSINSTLLNSKVLHVQSHVSAHCLRVVCALLGCDLTRSLSHITSLSCIVMAHKHFFQVLNRAQRQANPIPSTIDTRKVNAQPRNNDVRQSLTVRK